MLIACNKPTGITSFDVVKIIRTHFQDKVWHSGTLDPLASGLMVLGIGNGTKQLSELSELDKEYITTIDFSLLTDTRDAEFWEKEERFNVVNGNILLKDWKQIPAPAKEEIEGLLSSLLYHEGKEVILPLPSFSAKKSKGERLYESARKGIPIKQEKTMQIYSFDILKYTFPLLKVKLHVGSGTYIRSIGYRLGQQLGTGGSVITLERTKIGKAKLTSIGENHFAKGNIKGKERTIYYQELTLEEIIAVQS